MLAGPNSTIELMCKALYRTIAALDAASEIDMDRAKEDHDFFAAEKGKLEGIATKVSAARGALDLFTITETQRHQARVELGDEVLDRGVRAGNARTKLGVKGRSGLDATHVFGQRVNDLVDEPMRVEPSRVLAAAERLDDLQEFPERSAIKQDLIARATQQEKLLEERDLGEGKKGKLASAAVAAVVDGALALLQTKAALDGRFPRQRKYVASFFLDVTRERKQEAESNEALALVNQDAGKGPKLRA